MRRFHLTHWAWVLLVLSTLVFASLIFLGRRSKNLTRLSEVPEQRARIDSAVTKIAKENWDQSIANLLTNESQFDGEGYGGGSYFSEVQLEQVLACRRAVKILNTLGNLADEERLQRCVILFDRTLHALEDAAFENARTREKFGPYENGGGKFKYQPMHAVCLALFATAETGRLDVLSEQFKKLDDFQKRFENFISDKKSYDSFGEIIRKSCIQWCVPQPRFQLNVIRVAALRNTKSPHLLEKIDSLCQSQNLRSNQVSIVAWNARTTWFERRVGSAPDFSKGVTKFLFYDWAMEQHATNPSEEDVRHREMVRKIRELAF